MFCLYLALFMVLVEAAASHQKVDVMEGMMMAKLMMFKSDILRHSNALANLITLFIRAGQKWLCCF